MRTVAELQQAAQMREEWTKERKGQSAFNVVNILKPHVSRQIRGTEDDPFFDDERLEAFWTRVGELL